MKLYNSMGPNPHMVRMYAAELGVDLALEDVDLMGGENRQAAFLAKNPSGQSPALELDDGTVLAEITAICEYLDDITDGKTLIGSTPEERANTHMWTRRVDLNICEPLGNGFRYAEGLQIFESRMITIPEAADGLKRIAQAKLTWLDEQMSDGREFIAGASLSMADILLYSMMVFFAGVGQPLNPENTNVQAWFDRMAARPSAQA
ncbi:MAG: glutathione S-transferase [Pseudomonadales bacterium]|jgi:glutathione S-transferase|nr:glutathione S-transferase [Gammaproteobacteria bacterium]MDP6187006.1 glutathione S-transferase [Pseudomonadales bacterium]RPG34184.1 MAG: glutathione S-transferase [Gammaproteobacteria bacterium TMED243]